MSWRRKSGDPKQVHAWLLTAGTTDPSRWSALVKHYYAHGLFAEALLLCVRALCCRAALLPLLLRSCAALALLPLAASLHADSLKFGHATYVRVATSLLSAYSACGSVASARQVFDEMPHRNPVTRNAMLTAYLAAGDLRSAWTLFVRMGGGTHVSWTLMIRGFARTGDVAAARWLFESTPDEARSPMVWTAMVHAHASNDEMEAAVRLLDAMPHRNAFVWSSVVDGYFRMGRVEEARKVFERIPGKNVVNWNVLIAGYARNARPVEALESFEHMVAGGWEPDEITVVGALSASSQLGSLDHGRRIHDLIDRTGIKANEFVLCALLDMYAKCGDIERARGIFKRMRRRNSVCWNSMISGLSSHGLCDEALEVFTLMEEAKARPDEITYLLVLSACAHGGRVEEGVEIFRKMERGGLVPGVSHYGCLVDLLGRAGRLEEAYHAIERMPVEPNLVVWGSFLGACRLHSDTAMAEKANKELGRIGISDTSCEHVRCMLLSNIYTAAEKWEKAENLRREMASNGIQKIPGCSSIAAG